MIDALPDPPSRDDPASFANKADALLSALPNFVDQANALEQSLQLVATTGTSATFQSIGTGSQSFATQPGKAWVVGAYVYVVDATNVANLMYGQVTAYNALSGSLTVSVSYALGGGGHSDWVIGLSAPSTGSPYFGSVTSGAYYIDANFVLSTDGGNPVIVFDALDVLTYIRSANRLDVVINGADVFRVDETQGPHRLNDASTANGLVRKSQLDAATQQATDTARGTVELATIAEGRAGLNGLVAVSPEVMAASTMGGAWQSLQDMTSSRDITGSTFTNGTGRTIICTVTLTLAAPSGAGAGVYDLLIDGNNQGRISVGDFNGSAAGYEDKPITFPVPPGSTYRLSFASGPALTLTKWSELR